MKYYIIGDTHFNHTPEMQLYCNRPNDFEEKISDGLKRLGWNDTLIHLGDICIGNDQATHDNYIKPLCCRRILVRGNHDKKSNTWYLNNGWDFVCKTFTDHIFGLDVLFSHVPMSDNGYDINLHAHLHNLGHRDGEFLLVKNDKQILYSPEDFHYQPMPISYFLEK